MSSKGFPLGLVKAKGALYDVESLFRKTRVGAGVPIGAQTINNHVALEGLKTSFESAFSLLMIGMGTDKGLLPNLEERVFERRLAQKVLELRDSGYTIECNHSTAKKLPAVTTQASELLATEHIWCGGKENSRPKKLH